MLVFEYPQFLIFLLLVPIVIFFHSMSLHQSKKRALMFSNFEAMKRVHERFGRPKNVFWILSRVLIVILFSFAMAGTALTYETDINQADYVLALDSSSSMLTTDVSPTRFEAAKNAEIAFLDSLSEEGAKSRVALITFSGSTFIHSPLTYETSDLKTIINDLSISNVPGTAIGEAIMNGANLLYESDNAKIMYLITDGQSNVGIDVDFAIDYAIDNALTVNTIGIGSIRDVPIDEGRLSSSLDENNLKEIANKTGGEYYHTTSVEELKTIFENEKQNTTRGTYKLDLTRYLLLIILGMFLLEWIAISTNLKTIP